MLKRNTKGMSIPKYTVEEIEKKMTTDDAIKLVKYFENKFGESK